MDLKVDKGSILTLKGSQWGKDSCRSEAARFNSRYQFQLGAPGAYSKAKREGWLDEICAHMRVFKRWDFAACQVEARKYTTRTEFQKACGSAYNKSRQKGWLDEICQHMEAQSNPAGTWTTREACHQEALKYSTPTDFARGSGGAFQSAFRNGWLNEICEHMPERESSPYYWTKEKCSEIAISCSSRSEFERKNRNAYRASIRWDWLDDICKHMDALGSKAHRFIYKISFKDGASYVGYSYDPQERIASHLRNSSNPYVRERVANGELACVYIGPERLSIEVADRKEKDLIASVRECEDSISLNILDGGQRGGSQRIWTKEECGLAASGFSRRIEFIRAYRGAYASARKLGILDEICSHMEGQKWDTLEAVEIKAKNYTTRKDFQKGAPGAYDAARNNGWLEEICKHMRIVKRPKGTWVNIEACRLEASKYDNMASFRKGSRGAHKSAEKHGWLEQICEHMN